MGGDAGGCRFRGVPGTISFRRLCWTSRDPLPLLYMHLLHMHPPAVGGVCDVGPFNTSWALLHARPKGRCWVASLWFIMPVDAMWNGLRQALFRPTPTTRAALDAAVLTWSEYDKAQHAQRVREVQSAPPDVR